MAPIQAARSRPDLKAWGIGDRGNQRGGSRRTDTGNVIEASADFARAIPGEDAAIRVEDLVLHRLKLSESLSSVCVA